ncbi:MAG: UDP-N-acetylmuramate dehydrogenase [Lachnospiraceae bacterium]|nr:UDP-N-acetylmuramate dehydrogenase [Lachnospiraceae bacterium]
MLTGTVIETITEYTSPERVKTGETLSAHTSFRIGGAAGCFVEIGSPKELTDVSEYLKREKIRFFVLGNGSNTLFSDEGFDGVVLHIGKGLSEIKVRGNVIYAGAGALLSAVSKQAAANSLSGLEFAAGIPGTVGGGLVMNAGAYDGEMKQVVKSAQVITPEGGLRELGIGELKLDYRSSILRHSGYIVTGVTFELKPGDKNRILGMMEDFGIRRREKQPLELPSAGSTFKRPEGNFAGKLIMDAELRGFQIGGARVSDKHCGFIVNTGNATSEDVVKLIETVQKRVYERFGVMLEPEIEIVK